MPASKRRQPGVDTDLALHRSDSDVSRETHTIALQLIAVALLLTGCTGIHYQKLRSEREIAELAILGNTYERIPIARVETTSTLGSDRTLRLAMEQLGEPSADRVVVMLHGFLSDRTIWRYVSGQLGRDHRLLLIDLLGCGESDKPDPEELGHDGYSATAQARYTLRALHTYFGRSERPRRITLVGHSYGGAVVLRMLGDPTLRREFTDILDRVDGAVLLAPLDFAIEKADPRYLKLMKLGETKVSIAESTGLLREEVARMARDSVVDPSSMPREYADRALQILRERDRRRALQAMIRQAVPYDLKRKRPEWPDIEKLTADYQNVGVPTLILWGARDETFPASMGHKLRAQLPAAWLRVIRNSMHSLPLERPKVSAAYIRDFIRSRGQGWEPIAEVDREQLMATADTLRLAGPPQRQPALVLGWLMH